MRVCFLGPENLPVLAPEYRGHTVGGEAVQQTLLARALARRGHDVSMVVADYGQPDGASWEGIRTFRTCRPDAGLPVARFVHPRWTGTWAALGRADADVYYTSCAGMHVGLLAMFCRRHRRRFVFRAASDTDCDRDRLLVRYARDRWLYGYGLRRADAVLVQSRLQAETLHRSYGLDGRVAGMLVDRPASIVPRDIDLLWLANVRPLKRPDRMLELADRLQAARIHMAGGPLPGEEACYRETERAAAARPNIHFHGPLPYHEANALYGRARVLVNTSDIEGFPNTYLQAWIRGVPVVALIDPDGVIAREGLGAAARSLEEAATAVRRLLGDADAWKGASERCRAFMAREFGEEHVLRPYLEAFSALTPAAVPGRQRPVPRGAPHV